MVSISFSRDLPDPGIEPRSPALHVDSLPTELQGKPSNKRQIVNLTEDLLYVFVFLFLFLDYFGLQLSTFIYDIPICDFLGVSLLPGW